MLEVFRNDIMWSLITCMFLLIQSEAVAPLLLGQRLCFESFAEAEETDSQEHLLCCDYDDCESPMTLFQWSHSPTFEGGPAGRDEPLVTDRPDFTEASTTVGQGVAQFEFGYTYAYDNNGTVQTHSHSSPELLMRLGVLAEWLELRVGYSYGNTQETPNVGPANSLSGSNDLYLGFKIGLTPQAGLLPEMALIPQMTVPTGSASQTAGETLPGVNWLYGWDITDFISTGGSSQYNRALDATTSLPYGLFAQSWTICYQLTERLGAYTEWFVLVPDGADTEQTQHYFDGGFTFLMNNDLQIDVRAGIGASEASDDYFLGSGMSVRF